MNGVEFEGPEGDLDVYLSKGAYEQVPTVKGWKLDPELSGVNRSVYTKDGKAVVSFKGSDFSNPKSKGFWDDLGSDILLFGGAQGVSSRFKNAVKTVEQAKQKYGSENVSTTGHSLGGAQSLHASRKAGV